MSKSEFEERKTIGFSILMITEIWERFGFYTISGLLVLYMTKSLHFSDQNAFALFAAFSTLIYITPTIGGYIADNFLGYHRSLVIGIGLLFAGYICLALHSTHYFYPGLALIIIGCGFFKSMPYAMIGRMFKGGILESVFTLYYIAINIGAVLGLLFAGIVAESWGWQTAFMIAAIGLAVGITTYFFGRRFLRHTGNAVDVTKPKMRVYCVLMLATGLVFYLTLCLLKVLVLIYISMIFLACVVTIYLLYQSFLMQKKEALRLRMALLLTLFACLFFSLYYQQPMSMTLFVDRNVDRHFFSWVIPTASFWALNPFWLVVLGPVFSWGYVLLAKKGVSPSLPLKFGVGVLLMGVAYLFLFEATHFYDAHFKISPWWVVWSYLLQSIAELLINALGPAMVMMLVPQRLVGVVIGVWFLASAAGGLCAGLLARLAVIPKGEIAPHLSLPIYGHAFFVFGVLSTIIGLLACYFSPKIARIIA
jgi:POT family proton-dependent oligopeptide transporter